MDIFIDTVLSTADLIKLDTITMQLELYEQNLAQAFSLCLEIVVLLCPGYIDNICLKCKTVKHYFNKVGTTLKFTGDADVHQINYGTP